MSLRTALDLDMLVPTFAGDIWSVARYASQCDVHTKLNTVWVRGMFFMFYGEMPYLTDRNVGAGDHGGQEAV